MYICISKLTIDGSDNGSPPGQRQAIIRTNAGILLIWPSGKNFSEILIEIQIVSFEKMHLKMPSAKWQPFCLNLNVLTHWGRVTHICLGKLTIIDSDNGLSPGRRQAIIWTNTGLLLIGPLGTNSIQIVIGIYFYPASWPEFAPDISKMGSSSHMGHTGYMIIKYIMNICYSQPIKFE